MKVQDGGVGRRRATTISRSSSSSPARWQAALADGWPDDAVRAPLRGAALGLAIELSTWRTLARGQALDDAQVVKLMVALVRCAAHSALDPWPGADL
jgi:hypothetical protein